MKKGNLLDLLIILILGFSIVSGLGRFFEMRTVADRTAGSAIVVLHIAKTDARMEECVAVGETVYLASGDPYGRVEAVRSTGAEILLEEAGVFYSGVWEEERYSDTEIEIRIEGVDGGGGFLRDGKNAVLAGQRLSLYTERAYLWGEIREVRILRAE